MNIFSIFHKTVQRYNSSACSFCLLVILFIRKISCYYIDLCLPQGASSSMCQNYYEQKPPQSTFMKMSVSISLNEIFQSIFYQVKDRWKEIAKIVYVKAFNVWNCMKDCFKVKDIRYFSNTKLSQGMFIFNICRSLATESGIK